MEAGGSGGGGGGGRRRLGSRETSPDRARAGNAQQQQQRLVRPMKKVQVVYYLSRNGQLEHPHFMELPQLPNQHLRLKDVMDRLTVLRGRGMPSLFSWSCKRSYKNGYVWNDLAENDIIYPADGAEYVLKGSEIIQACSEKFQHVRITNRQPKPLQISQNRHQIEVEEEEEGMEEEEEGEQDVIEEEVVDKFGKVTATGAYITRCSRGISTDEIERVEKPIKTRDQPTELSLDDASPPSSSSSDKAPAVHRFEDGDPAGEPGLTRNSVLLQLIACGSVSVKGRAAGGGGGGGGGGGLLKAAVSSAAAAAAAGASSLAGGRRGGASNKGSVSRFASRAGDEDELRCVSENPRFGHPPLEEKEYFSGSIVEGSRGPPGPSLKKSNSYNEERSSKLGIGERRLEVEEETGGLKGKCIPGRKKPSGKQQEQQPKKGSQ